MNKNTSAKCQWLEKKCKEYQAENSKLRKTLQKVEKMSTDRGVPSQMYRQEVDWATCLITNALNGNGEGYSQFMKIPSPQSYNDLYYKILPDIQKSFSLFTRSIKKYIEFLQPSAGKLEMGPIFVSVSNEHNVILLDKIGHVRAKINNYKALLESSSWSVSLDQVAKQIKTDILVWLDKADNILRDISGYLQPKIDMCIENIETLNFNS